MGFPRNAVIPAVTGLAAPLRGRACAPLLLGLCVLSLLFAHGCTSEEPGYYQGYVEAEYVYVSSPLGGILETLDVGRGMTVEQGDRLFTLEPIVEQAEVAEAEAMVQRAEKKMADLAKGLRPTELAVIEARLAQARTDHDLARTEYARRRDLFADKVISKDELDRSRAELERNAARVGQLRAELAAAKLGGRPDALAAARAEIEAARGGLTRARWRLEQQLQTAPRAGLVFDTYYVPGESVPASYPVVSILPPAGITVRFFVPETDLAALSTGREVTVRLDGTTREYRATVSYISPRAEYTPPVIYSRNTRAKLVYMIEARLPAEEAARLHPGQPVDVLPEPAHD